MFSAENGNFGGYDKQSYVVSPQQSPNELYSRSYGQSRDGNQSVVNEYRNGNYGAYYGNFGGYYRQSYVVVPLQNPNTSHSRSNGQSDAVYQVVNGDWNLSAGIYHQSAGYSFMDNVAYRFVNGNCDPYVGQFHHTFNVETNQLNGSSPQVQIGEPTYNIVGQNGNLSGYDRQSYHMLPQQSPYGPCDASYGRSACISGCEREL